MAKTENLNFDPFKTKFSNYEDLIYEEKLRSACSTPVFLEPID